MIAVTSLYKYYDIINPIEIGAEASLVAILFLDNNDEAIKRRISTPSFRLLQGIGVERKGSRSKSFIAISNIVGTIGEALNYRQTQWRAWSHIAVLEIA